MLCYDCAKINQEKTAMAICQNCGAGLCLNHVQETEVVMTTTVIMNRQVPLPIKSRRLLCGICLAADLQPQKGSW